MLQSVIFCPASRAQEIRTEQLPEVRIVSTNARFFSDDKNTQSVNLKSVFFHRQQNLDYLLYAESPALVKSYGSAGSLVSLSLRGTGSNHTQVSWNGFPLNSPATGQADLSLIPAGTVQSVEIIYGASGALYGSGTFGGLVDIRNEPDFRNRISVDYSFGAGSYGTLGHLLNLKTGNQHWQYHLSAVTGKAENDFFYRDHYRFNAPRVKATHNSYHTLGIIQNVFYNGRKGNYFEAGMWHQYKYKDIPSQMGSYRVSNASQKDSIFRTYLSYRKTFTRSMLLIKAAYFADYLRYTDKIERSDPEYSVFSNIATRRFMTEAEFRHYLASSWVFGAGAAYNFLAGNSGNFGGYLSENEYALHASVKFTKSDWIFNAAIRKEFYEDVDPSPQYAVGLRHRIGEWLTLRTGISSKFRKPTFNEKYWKPGGNPSLRPEKGWGGDLAVEFLLSGQSSNTGQTEITVNGYYQVIENWIQWIIKDSLTPVEYKKVHAKGVEVSLTSKFSLIGLDNRFDFSYNYRQSVIMDTYDDNMLFRGNQLAYVPKHSARISFTTGYRGIQAGLQYHFTGSRETVESADESLRLPPYGLVDLVAGYTGEFKNMRPGLYFRMENIFNRQYEVIRSFPMPGRTFYITATMGLHKDDTNY
jgi:outer membrane cobalamin receptor